MKDAFIYRDTSDPNQVTRLDPVIRKVNRIYSISLNPNHFPDFVAPVVVKSFYQLMNKYRSPGLVKNEKTIQNFIEISNRSVEFLQGIAESKMYTSSNWQYLAGEQIDINHFLSSLGEKAVTQLVAGQIYHHPHTHKLVPTIIGTVNNNTVKIGHIDNFGNNSKALQELAIRGFSISPFSLISLSEGEVAIMISSSENPPFPRSFLPFITQVRALLHAQVDIWRSSPNLTPSLKKTSNTVVNIFKTGNIVEDNQELRIVNAEIIPLSGKIIDSRTVSGDIASHIFDQMKALKLDPTIVGLKYSKGEKKLTL